MHITRRRSCQMFRTPHKTNIWKGNEQTEEMILDQTSSRKRPFWTTKDLLHWINTYYSAWSDFQPCFLTSPWIQMLRHQFCVWIINVSWMTYQLLLYPAPPCVVAAICRNPGSAAGCSAMMSPDVRTFMGSTLGLDLKTQIIYYLPPPKGCRHEGAIMLFSDWVPMGSGLQWVQVCSLKYRIGSSVFRSAVGLGLQVLSRYSRLCECGLQTKHLERELRSCFLFWVRGLL